MNKKTKIVVAGIGGIGGYFGGLLAKQFYNSETVEVSFIARGEHLKAIQKNGLKIFDGKTEFIAKPYIATDNPSEIGVADFVIKSSKSYDLETMVKQLKPCIDKDTIILPLLNGVDSRNRIKNVFPNNLVLEGCCFIISFLKQAGVIENDGSFQKLYFGLDNYTNDKLNLLEKLFKEASIDVHYSENISTIIWEKFIFISPIATATSYFDRCIGEIMADSHYLGTTTLLFEEIVQLAKAKNIKISENIIEKTLNKLKATPFEVTTSMHRDFINKKPKTEWQTLTSYVVNEGKKHNLTLPTYLKLNEELGKLMMN